MSRERQLGLWKYSKMKQRTIEVLERNYLNLVEIASAFYTEGVFAVQSGSYNEASILQNQGDC